jgi:hypothetical protein
MGDLALKSKGSDDVKKYKTMSQKGYRYSSNQ